VERALLITVALSAILAPLNSTMIAVALPRIMHEFNASVGAVSWLIIGYLIVIAALQPVAGKIGDRLGRQPLLLCGFATFGIASTGAAFAPNLATLVSFRVLQAVAGAVALPNALALLRDCGPVAHRAARFGLIGSVVALAAALGPTLAGLLVAAAGWRAVFYVNAPIVLVGLVTVRWLPPSTAPASGQTFDVVGSVLLCGILAGTGELLANGRGSPAPVTAAVSVLVLVIASALFLQHELGHPDPVLDPRLLAIPSFAAASSAVALSSMSFYATLLATPIVLSARSGWTSIETGLALTTLSAPVIVFGPLGGRLADRRGRRLPAVAGHALAAAALFPLAFGADASQSMMLVSLPLAGIGFGLAAASLQVSGLESVASEHAGVASGFLSTSRSLGGMAGSVALAALLKGRSGEAVAEFRGVAMLVSAAAFAAMLASLGLLGLPEGSRGASTFPSSQAATSFRPKTDAENP
jgi:EmrB/QacA subfamily drug resistance transporter